MESIQYGTQTINFHIQRVDRKTLGIEVHPDLSVWAMAPLKVSLKDIKEKMLKRSSWIVRQRQFFEQFLPRTPERQYVSGETHLYLGRRYVLRIRKGRLDQVKLKGSELVVTYTADKSRNHIKQLMTAWYYNHASKKFDEKIKKALEKFKSFNIEKPIFEIRRMKNRWGSCTPKGKIILNPELIKSPGRCIDYVIMHEMCHLINPNHGKEFYALQDEINPDSVRWKNRLEQFLN
ncbi:MAG: M48 family metallopeptidase [Crocinitomicaceae bacterium]|nr:M48 family metallopeptidase [Crocinitomicaceae bacterium]